MSCGLHVQCTVLKQPRVMIKSESAHCLYKGFAEYFEYTRVNLGKTMKGKTVVPESNLLGLIAQVLFLLPSSLDGRVVGNIFGSGYKI